MRVFNPQSTPILVGEALIPGGEHGEIDDSDRVRQLVDDGLLVASEEPQSEPEASAKRGGSK